MREHKDFRPILEQLNARYERELLTTADVMQITGYKSANSVRAHFPMVRGRIAKAKLARILCEEGER